MTDPFQQVSSLIHAQHYDEALRLLNQLIRANGAVAMTYHLRAIVYRKMKKPEAAMKDHDRSIEIEVSNADFYSERGVTWFHLKENKKAFEDLDRSLSLDPANAYRYSSRAYMRDRLGDTHGAVEDYKKAIELDPDDAIAHNNLGMLEEKLGRQKSAKKRFNKADELAKKEDFPQYEKPEPENAPKVRSVDPSPSKETATKQQSLARQYFAVIKSVFTSKSEFKHFVQFIGRLWKKKPGA